MSQSVLKAAVIGFWFLSGAAVEVFSSWTRRWTADQLAPGEPARSVSWFVGVFFLRVVLTAGVLFLAFRHSFVSGLVAWLGYYVCRMVLILRLSRRLERRSARRSDEGEPKLGSENG